MWADVTRRVGRGRDKGRRARAMEAMAGNIERGREVETNLEKKQEREYRVWSAGAVKW